MDETAFVTYVAQPEHVDTPEDLTLAREIMARFPGRDDFTWKEILALFKAEPELATINSAVVHKNHLDVDSRNQ